MLRQILDEQKPLIVFGGVMFGLFAVLAIISIFDTTQILGIGRWIKPMKFASSIGIFVWTVAVYLHFIEGRDRAKTIITWGIIPMMIGEIILITMRAARGTTSHFNNDTAFDTAVFAAMGAMIAINTIFVGYLLVLYFRTDIDLPRTVIWGMRAGVILTLLASFEGGYMAQSFGHSVGAMDGGPGLPFFNWSTIVGDLRVAHFIGLHALQIVPLVAVIVERLRIPGSKVALLIFAALYFVVFTFAFIQALLGIPLLQLGYKFSPVAGGIARSWLL